MSFEPRAGRVSPRQLFSVPSRLLFRSNGSLVKKRKLLAAHGLVVSRAHPPAILNRGEVRSNDCRGDTRPARGSKLTQNGRRISSVNRMKGLTTS